MTDWETTYNNLPLETKMSLSEKADKMAAEYIRTLPEWQKAEAEYKRWRTAEGRYIFGTAGKTTIQYTLYMEHYERMLSGLVK